MIELYQARDRIEAQFLKDYLFSHLVESVILGDFLSGAAGELPAMQFPTVWLVNDDDESRARVLLSRFLESRNTTGEAWECEQCGEASEAAFELCWNCGSPRPEA